MQRRGILRSTFPLLVEASKVYATPLVGVISDEAFEGFTVFDFA
jgi:hypothetical protein